MAEPQAAQQDGGRIISLDRYSLYGASPNSAGRKARLVWSVREGAPRITVFTNDPGDSDPKQMISALLDPVSFHMLTDLIVKCASSKEEIRFIVDCFNPVRDEGGKMIDKTLASQIAVGKDSAGLVWISVIAENRPKIKFVFSGNDFNLFKNGDGTPKTDSEISCAMAVSTMRCLVPIMTIFFQMAASDFAARPKQQQGQRGGAPAGARAEKKETATAGGFDDDIPY